MKKIILSLFILAAGVTSAFANDDTKVSEKVKSAFSKDFSSAKNVTWKQDGEFLKASFTIADMLTNAYYNEDGELLGSARNLSFEQLPLSVIHEFNKRFDGSSVISITEITNGEGTSYRIWAEKDERKFKVSATSQGELAILEKSKK